MYVMYVCLKMVNSKNLKNPKMITTIIEADEYQQLRKNLGHRNFTDWLREQIKQYNEGIQLEKNELAPIRCPISQSQVNNNNTTLDKYIPNWMIDHKNHKRLNEIQDRLGYKDQIIVVTALNNIHRIWKGRLPRKVLAYRK
jgi:hypothetical protein